ncbi:TIGR03620 family F420-dependent LLM class oxidoreductase [Amycolatopsis umgeniensis]|uniref:Putative F420-dependent oxidoreductase n=1 Tax=Amycolatopsis umgeniensis TaxID=336628 RepID=A0A841B0C7_9PSEU|nr:TIGR03620 family F420-dependent LLM class oxidoreductase [Amycolatopsis umgeniensis]MBB5852125.1 putative F420-dependent oxidoreductase [Amycolatopsis umgeniensis]
MNLIEDTRDRLGPVGVWLPVGMFTPTPDEERRATQRLEQAGYRTVWGGEGPGNRELFAYSAITLAATERVVVGTGIANIWSRPAYTTQSGGRTLAQAFPGRFVLGVGIGHAHQAAKTGSAYRPLEQTRDYLAGMSAAEEEFPSPVPFPRILAAVGPKMLELARDMADGAHPFAQPFEHTPYAREILGQDKLLIPTHSVLLGDREQARADVAKSIELMKQYDIPHYFKGWKRLGYTDADIDGVSDRLVDGLTAWGDEEKIAARIKELVDAGADTVLVTPVGDDLETLVTQLERLAPALTAVAR